MTPAPANPSRQNALPVALLLVVAVLAVYANSLKAPFIFDDFPAVVRNTTIRDLGKLSDVLHPPLDGAGVTGRPLVNLSYAINHSLHGLSGPGYHIGSILLHAFGALALFGVLRRTSLLPGLRGKWGEGATARAGAIALVWAVHPLLTESVVCVAQRNEVLVGLFYFLTFYAFVRSVEEGAPRARWWQLASVAACWLGMASKEVMATAPLLVLLYDRAYVAGNWPELWHRRKYYYAGLLASWLLLAWLMAQTNQRQGIVGFGLGMSSWDYLVTQCRALALYVKLAVWPHPLVVDYGPVTFRLGQVWPEAIGVVAAGLATLWALWRHPKVGFFGAWFFVILAPSSSFVPLTTQTIAEHRMYLPLVALVVGGLLGLELIARHRRLWVAGGLAVVFGLITVRRNADYLDELRFWQDTIARQPANARVWASLGYYHLRHQEWNEAIAAYEKAITLRDNFADAHSDLGSLLLEVGRIKEAVEHERLAMELKPSDPAIRFNYGMALEKAGDRAGAVQAWTEVLRLRPGLGAAHRRLGLVALADGRAAAATEHFASAVAADVGDVESLAGWGQALTQLDRLPEAVERFQSALALSPSLAELHYNLGNVRLQMNQAEVAAQEFTMALNLKTEFTAARHNLALALVRLGRPVEAVPHYEQVLRELPGSAQVHHNLALALASAGRVPEAIAQDEAALRIDPAMTEARELLTRLRGR